MQNLVHQMTAILEDWSNRFDILQELPLRLIVSDRGEVYLNEIRLPWFSDLTLERATFDPETICFLFAGDCFLKIIIQWPEDEPPYISAVFFGYGNADEAAV